MALGRRRLGSRIEAQLAENSYSWQMLGWKKKVETPIMLMWKNDPEKFWRDFEGGVFLKVKNGKLWVNLQSRT